MAKKRYIRNSTAEFLILKAQNQEQTDDMAKKGSEVLYHDETIWATQKAMAELFGIGVPAINKHLAIIKAVICGMAYRKAARVMLHTRADGHDTRLNHGRVFQ